MRLDKALEIAGAGAWLAYDELLVGAGERLMARPSSRCVRNDLHSRGVERGARQAPPERKGGDRAAGFSKLDLRKWSHTLLDAIFILNIRSTVGTIQGVK